MAICVALMFLAANAGAQSLDAPQSWTDRGMFITEGDIANCPYHAVGTVEANVHSATIFGHRPDLKKVVGEIRERAAKLHADAVVKAAFSPEHATMVWGRVVSGTGQAVRFASPCPNPIVAK